MVKPLAEVSASPPYGQVQVAASDALPDGHAAVRTVEDLQKLLRAIAADCPRPVIVTVIRADGDMLSIGVGRPVSFLTFIPKDNMPPYFSVHVASNPEEEVCFDYNGEPSFYSARNTVPFELALEVVRRFVLSSGLPLPDLVPWAPA
jgi:hypothetical protein